MPRAIHNRDMRTSPPLVGLTMGDPAGIGPELCLRMLSDRAVLRECIPVVFGDAALLGRVAGAAGLPRIRRVVSLDAWRSSPEQAPVVVDLDCVGQAPVRPGRVAAVCGLAAYRCIAAAVEEALQGRIAGIATAPIHKEALRLGGIPHPGHTEILAALTKTKRYCMMMMSDRISTALVTTHTRLASVPGLLSVPRIAEVIELASQAMRRIRGRRPRIVVCALNPHAGEHGLMGEEEERLIVPAIRAARTHGITVEGPLPPDTAFLPDRLETTDAYVCMYHDQGLIPFKMLSFETGINVTLGLPIVRTSPDHGTAFDMAWTGRANPSSMRAAVLHAARLGAAGVPARSGVRGQRGSARRASRGARS